MVLLSHEYYKTGPPVKRHNPEGPGPEVRPVQVEDPLFTTIWKALLRDMQDKFEAIFRPEQVAVGVKGGLSIMIHGITGCGHCCSSSDCYCTLLSNAQDAITHVLHTSG